MKNDVPQRLYKYVGVHGERWEHLRSAVLDRRIFYSSRTRFNDPYDLAFQLPDSTRATAREWIEEGLRMSLSPMQGEEREAKVKERFEVMFPQGITEEVRRAYVGAIKESLDRVAILCLSARPDILLMWSHYSEGGKGAALIFDATRTAFLSKVQAVQYASKFVPHSSSGSVAQRAERLLLTKSLHWAYEEEYRSFRNVRANSCADFPAGALVGLILGPNIEKKTESNIRELLEGAPDKILLHRAVMSDDDFKLAIESA